MTDVLSAADDELKAEIGTLRAELRRLGRFDDMLGRSPAMQQLYEQLARVAPTEVSVLLAGESGTGKALAARALHDLSRRRRQAFVAVDCGATTPQRLEEELFGRAADGAPAGAFERARGGTLFLDEIAEMPAALQARLLRALDSGRCARVGSADEFDVNARVIAATRGDPAQAVAEKRLRADLYQRLNVFPLTLPPLREREGDVALLAQHFLDRLNAEHRTRKRFRPPAPASLAALPWPGNVRELKTVVERAYALADNELELPGAAAAAAASPATASVTVPVGTSLDEADRRLILATLEQCRGVKKVAAQMLGVSLKTLYNRLEEYRAQGIVPRRGADGREPAGQHSVRHGA